MAVPSMPHAGWAFASVLGRTAVASHPPAGPRDSFARYDSRRAGISGSSAVMKRDRAESFDRRLKVRLIATPPHRSLLEARPASFDRRPRLSFSRRSTSLRFNPFGYPAGLI